MYRSVSVILLADRSCVPSCNDDAPAQRGTRPYLIESNLQILHQQCPNSKTARDVVNKGTTNSGKQWRETFIY